MLTSIKKSFRLRAVAAAACMLAAVAGTGSAGAQTVIYGIGGTDTGNGPNASAYTLFSFNSNAPGAVTNYGTVTPTTGYALMSIAFQPGTGQLFGLQFNGSTNQAQLLTINRTTAASAPVGSPFTIGSIAGTFSNSAVISFNPTNGAIRLDTGTQGNYRLNASTGAIIAQDANLNFAPSPDPNANNVPQISGIGYTQANPTTLYGYDYASNSLVTQNITPGTASPSGQLATIGFSNLQAIQGANSTGFTVGLTGAGFLNSSVLGDATPAVRDHLYSVNLANGTVTDVGFIGASATFNTVDIAALVPEPGTWVTLALGGLGLLAWRGRSRRAA